MSVGRNGFGEIIVEFLGDVARQFDVLLLVLADGNMGGAIKQDVRRHQGRIGEKADRGVLAILAGLFLELGHAIEPADAGDAIENPGQLRVFRDLALIENDVFDRVDARGDIGGGDLADRLAQRLRLLGHGDRVQIDDAEQALMRLLQARRI